jgi:MYXO-CTERM domain-containing protein
VTRAQHTFVAGLLRLGWLAAVLSALFCSSARADVLRLSYDETGSDPAADFDALCLGDTPADDCDTRAALIEGDLALVLSHLENDSDPQTLALFQEALELDSPVVQAMAVRYVSRAEAQPADFLSKVKTFFLGPDAPLGVTAADELGSSGDASDKELVDLYREQRSGSDYAPAPISDTSSEDHLLSACIKDARLDLMTSFTEEEQFAPAERLLMYDRFVRAVSDPTVDYPVTTFLTDASVEEVSAFFSALFGEPYGPIADAEAHVQTLSSELATLAGAAASGDQKAIATLTAKLGELTEAQKVLTLGSYYQLPGIHAENDVVWVDGSIDDLGTKLARAVAVGADPLLGKTVIRYINASDGAASGTPTGSGGDSGTPSGNGNGGDGTASGGDSGRAQTRSDSGCGCSVPGVPQRSAALTGFALLALLLRRARRRANGRGVQEPAS